MTTKGEDSKIQATEIKCLRAILNTTKKDKISNINMRFELWVDKIKK